MIKIETFKIEKEVIKRGKRHFEKVDIDMVRITWKNGYIEMPLDKWYKLPRVKKNLVLEE